MPRLQRKSFATPDEIRAVASGRVELILLDEIGIGRFVLQPGWRWSKDVAPVVGTRSCQERHIGYAISGSIRVTMEDGTELVIGAGDGSSSAPLGREHLRFRGCAHLAPGRVRRDTIARAEGARGIAAGCAVKPSRGRARRPPRGRD